MKNYKVTGLMLNVQQNYYQQCLIDFNGRQ